MSRRRAPQGDWERLAEGTRAQRVGGAGKIPSASPVAEFTKAVAAARLSTATATSLGFQKDAWTLTAGGAQAQALTYLPASGSEHIYLNGIEQDESVDWSRSGQTLSVLAPMGALTGDYLEARYAYLTGLPASILTTYPSAVIADAPLVYYRMNGSGSTEADISGHSRNGTMSGNYLRGRPSLLVNDPDLSTDFGNPSQGSTKPTGGACYVTCPYDAGLITTDWSFELWTNKGSSAPTGILQWTGRLRIELNGLMNVLFYSGPTTAASVATSSTGLLVGSDYVGGAKHLVVTYSASAQQIKYYFNGTQFGPTVTGVTTSMLSTTNPLNMGYYDGSDGLCDGDEFAFYGSALSATQVANHYAAR